MTERRRTGAPWYGRWPAHLGFLGIVLVLATWFVGFDGYVFVDEAALYAQVEIVEDGRWTVPLPLDDEADAQRYAPMHNATVVGDRFAPFPNHPLHVYLARAADAAAGTVGVRLLSTAGAIVSAAMGALLAARISRRHAIAAVWIIGVASPLLFDAQLVVAHAVAAPLVAGIVLLTAPRRRPAWTGLAVAILTMVGSLLRSEVILFAVALAVVLGIEIVRSRRWEGAVIAAPAVLGAALAYLVEPWWISRLVGGPSDAKVIAASSRGGAAGAVDAANTVLLGLGDDGAPAVAVAVVLMLAAVAVLRWRPDATPLAAVVAVIAAAACITQFWSPIVIPGVLWAFPLLTVSLLYIGRGGEMPAELRRATAAAMFLGVLVLALQYRSAGGFEWGWRYMAIVVPIVGAALTVPFLAMVDAASTRPARITVVAVTVAGVLVPASGVVQQRHLVDQTERLTNAVSSVYDDTGVDLIVSTDRLFGRFAWESSVAGRLVTVERADAELGELLALLDRSGHDRLLLVWAGSDPPSGDRSGYEAEGPEIDLLPGILSARVLVR